MQRAMAEADATRLEQGFLGWDVSRRFLTTPYRSLEFQLHKPFYHFDVDNYVDLTWKVYTDPTIFMYVLHQNRGRASLDVLQELAPTTMILHFQERYDEMAVTFHSLLLIARIEQDQGVIHIVRTIRVPLELRELGGSCASWTATICGFNGKSTIPRNHVHDVTLPCRLVVPWVRMIHAMHDDAVGRDQCDCPVRDRHHWQTARDIDELLIPNDHYIRFPWLQHLGDRRHSVEKLAMTGSFMHKWILKSQSQPQSTKRYRLLGNEKHSLGTMKETTTVLRNARQLLGMVVGIPIVLSGSRTR